MKAATAQGLGLSTFLPDERTDPEKSAHAAARDLRALGRRFGSWPLALAAYNAGEGRVGRALAARGAHDYAGIAAALPAGTRMYVPEVCALMRGARRGDARTTAAARAPVAYRRLRLAPNCGDRKAHDAFKALDLGRLQVVLALQILLGALDRRLGGVLVDLLLLDREFGEDRNLVARDLRKAAADDRASVWPFLVTRNSP